MRRRRRIKATTTDPGIIKRTFHSLQRNENVIKAYNLVDYLMVKHPNP